MNRKNVAALEILNRFVESMRDCIEVPNKYLPAEYHCNRGTQTLADLERKHEKMTRNVDPRNVKGSAERQAAIENYANQVALGLDIEYNENADKLYRNQMAFAQSLNLDLE
jgi:hypothetical protein